MLMKLHNSQVSGDCFVNCCFNTLCSDTYQGTIHVLTAPLTAHVNCFIVRLIDKLSENSSHSQSPAVALGITMSVCRLVQTEMSQQLLDGLPSNRVHKFSSG